MSHPTPFRRKKGSKTMARLTDSACGERPRRRRARLVAGAAVLAVALGAVSAAVPALAESSTGTPGSAVPKLGVASTTLNYVIRFYPRAYSWLFQRVARPNTLIQVRTGPDGLLGPKVKIGSAPNLDTVYGATFNMDLSRGPVILTLPKYDLNYSQLVLDIYGNVLEPGKLAAGGSYALTLPDWHGSLPAGVTRVTVPYRQTEWFIRADRYNNNVNTVAQAKAFVAGIRLAPLPEYIKDPNSGPAVVVPQAAVSVSTKNIIDGLIRLAPQTYLRNLQAAMHSPSTVPLTPSDRKLSGQFDAVYAYAQQAAAQGNRQPLEEMVKATRRAFSMVVSNYLTHVIPGTHWINFNNIGRWGTAYLDRASTAEYLIFANSSATSRYWDAFDDNQGRVLDTRTSRSYTITFPKADIPDAKRFWSVTAYVPNAISLASSKNVAEYTPGLKANPDGSITIVIQPNRPRPALVPNWLPVPRRGEFSLVLRVYGPQGNTATGLQYIPPEVVPSGR
jgi:hypothetical protein